MLYMVVERYRPGTSGAIYERLQAKGRQLPAGLEYLDSWVDLDRSVCFQLMRTDDARLFEPWIAAWSDLVDFEVTPVQSSAEAAVAAAADRGPQ